MMILGRPGTVVRFNLIDGSGTWVRFDNKTDDFILKTTILY